MNHRNKKLVYTYSDWEDSVDDKDNTTSDINNTKKRKGINKPSESNKRQKLFEKFDNFSRNKPRRSNRLAVKYTDIVENVSEKMNDINELSNTEKNNNVKNVIDERDNSEYSMSDTISNQNAKLVKNINDNSMDDINDSMDDFIVNDVEENDYMEEDIDEFINTSDISDFNNPGCTRSGLPIRNFMNLFDRKSSTEDYLKIIMREAWFKELSKEEQQKYLNKMIDLVTYPKSIPSIKDIIDINTERSNTKKLITERMELDDVDKLSEAYDDQCNKFIKQIDYLSKNKEEQEKITSIYKNISDNPKFYRSIHDRILSSNFSNDIKTIIYDKYLLMESSGEHDAPKYQTWIETALSLPYQSIKLKLDETIPQNEALSKLLETIMKKLNQKVFGMQIAKEELLCIVANMISNPKSKNKAIGMYGPPGIGKTMIVQVLAEVLGRPMELISLGGMTDSSYLEGHDFTYIGSQPGRIIKSLINMKCTNGILFFDELDKISKNSHNGKEVEHCLLHITDFTQNHDYRDKYMPEIPVDLSDCIFIYSMNSKDDLDSALSSRIPVVEFAGYNAQEKMLIVENYLFPEILENYGINKDEVILPTKTIQHLISIVNEDGKINGKSGVRGLKKALNNIVNRINLYRLASINGKLSVKLSFKIKNFVLPFTINNDLIDQIISDNAINIDEPYPQMYT